MNKYDTQSCCFSGRASSGQLGTRLTLVPHVFVFAVIAPVTGSCNSSTIPPRAWRRNGIQALPKIRLIAAAANKRLLSGSRTRRKDAADGSQGANASLLHDMHCGAAIANLRRTAEITLGYGGACCGVSQLGECWQRVVCGG
jgi:hypothetical protein